ncbi:MAG: FAD-dependent thymidylate synthase [Chloroflexota bacterium]|nr:FAD-dependent thymidylate synthase [Chloroflexota bacterium]
MLTIARSPQAEESPMIERTSVPELDAILGHQFKVLDDGFVRVVDYMGTDSSIVQAARVSYGTGTKRVREDRALIRYLLRHAHTTPFEMCDIKLHVRVPMDIWRQWIRHRTASVNEYSTRYSVAIDNAQRTPADEWRMQSTGNRQGSDGAIETGLGEMLTAQEAELHRLSREVYEHRLEMGVAREQARKDLPLSTYTEAYWKTNLHNLLHFLALRMDSHAQYEIREYARTIGEEIVAKWCPVAWEAFTDYRMNTVAFSEAELAIVEALIKGDPEAALASARQSGLVTTSTKDGSQRVGREARELEPKLTRLGLPIPW